MIPFLSIFANDDSLKLSESTGIQFTAVRICVEEDLFVRIVLLELTNLLGYFMGHLELLQIVQA